VAVEIQIDDLRGAWVTVELKRFGQRKRRNLAGIAFCELHKGEARLVF
jgi:hypothetical protein